MGQGPVSVSMLIAGYAWSLLAMHGGRSSHMHVDMLTETRGQSQVLFLRMPRILSFETGLSLIVVASESLPPQH